MLRTKPRNKKETQSIEELPEEAIRSRIKDARRAFRELARRDPAEVARSRGLREAGEEIKSLAETVRVGLQELERRQREEVAKAERALPSRMWMEAGRKMHERQNRDRALRPLRNAVAFIAKREYPTLREATLRLESLLGDDGLPSEEGLELVTLVGKLKEFGFGLAAEPLTDEERARYERLIGLACGDEQVFQRKREEAAAQAKAREMADELKVAMLDKRPRWEEPGSVTLPRYAVHDWLLDDGAREGDWTLADVGLLVAALAAFENRDAAYFVGARFDGEGAERALVIPGGVGADIRLYGAIAGSAMESGGSGHVRVRTALATLARNNWLVVEHSVAELRIKLGERAKKLREGHAAG